MQPLFLTRPVLMISRVALAFSWIYQGAVPKLVCRSSGEIAISVHRAIQPADAERFTDRSFPYSNT